MNGLSGIDSTSVVFNFPDFFKTGYLPIIEIMEVSWN